MQFKVSYPRVVIPLVPPVVFGVCFVFMVLLLIFRTVNPTLWDHRFQSGGQLKSLPIATYLDKEDLLLVRKFLVQPSTQPYNLLNPDDDPSRGQGQYVRKLLKEMRNGFFVEAGAHDGETMSNTLYLEKELNWGGLLVEGDPRLYAKLVSKYRKAWTSPACLATEKQPHRANYTMYTYNDMAGGLSSDNHPDPGAATGLIVLQCIPLHYFLEALGVTTVDYFSLDVEGSELTVLATIPFDNVFIKVISIEYQLIHGLGTTTTGVESLLEFFNDKDYQLVAISPSKLIAAHDVLFVHKSIFQ